MISLMKKKSFSLKEIICLESRPCQAYFIESRQTVQCNFRFVIKLNEKNAGCVCASMSSITVSYVNVRLLCLFLSIIYCMPCLSALCMRVT